MPENMSPQMADKIIEMLTKAGALSYLEIDGTSMEPCIFNRERVLVDHRIKHFEPGDVVLFEREDEEGKFLHRIVYMKDGNIITKGDGRFSLDKPITIENVLGKVTAIIKSNGTKVFIDEEPWKTFSKSIACMSYRSGLFHKELMKEKTGSEKEADKLHKEAYEKYHKGQLDEALAGFRKALAHNPEKAISRVDVGEILRQQGKGDEAIVHLRLALDVDRRETELSAQAYNIIGNTLIDKGKISESFEEYNSSLNVCPSFVPPYINRGWARFKAGDMEGAEADYRKALEMEADNFKAHKNLGHLLIVKNRFDEAEVHLEKAQNVRDNDSDVLNNIALIALRKKDYKKAEDYFRKAITLHPEHDDATFNLGIVLEDTGRVGEALVLYTKLFRKHPDDSSIRNVIYRIASRQEQKSEKTELPKEIGQEESEHTEPIVSE